MPAHEAPFFRTALRGSKASAVSELSAGNDRGMISRALQSPRLNAIMTSVGSARLSLAIALRSVLLIWNWLKSFLVLISWKRPRRSWVGRN